MDNDDRPSLPGLTPNPCAACPPIRAATRGPDAAERPGFGEGSRRRALKMASPFTLRSRRPSCREVLDLELSKEMRPSGHGGIRRAVHWRDIRIGRSTGRSHSLRQPVSRWSSENRREAVRMGSHADILGGQFSNGARTRRRDAVSVVVCADTATLDRAQRLRRSITRL